MIVLTGDQWQAIQAGEVVRVLAPEIGDDVVVLRADAYESIRERLEDEQEKAVWAKLARKAVLRCSQQHPI
jgi:hypothetical protein